MANDLFGGLGKMGGLGDALGGLMGGLAKSGLVPTDTPEGKLLQAQSELSSLQKQEAEILAEIGGAAYEKNPSEWPQDAKLKLIRQNMAAAQATLNEAKAATEQAEAAKQAEEAASTCPECGHRNPEGTKFCQECGAKVGLATAAPCPSCGTTNPPGTRFCGNCGAAQDA